MNVIATAPNPQLSRGIRPLDYERKEDMSHGNGIERQPRSRALRRDHSVPRATSGTRLAAILLMAGGLSGCLLSPTDDQRVSSTAEPLTFSGLIPEANAPVQARAWDFAANAMRNVGPVVRSSATPSVVPGTTPLYGWSVYRTLEPRFWRSGPTGGHCAVFGAVATVAGRVADAITVEPNWRECWNANPTVSGFHGNCSSSNSPVAKIYTRDWGSVPVPQWRLDVAGAVASSEVVVTLDNYTSDDYQYCRHDNPDGCPPGLSADPQTYKYYNPNASSITRGTDTLTFSITPPRSGSNTVYIDDMWSEALTFRADGSRFILDIDFEAGGAEIRLDCIRNFWCEFLPPREIDFPDPRASLSFALTVQDGKVAYTGVSTTFTPGSTSSEAAEAAAGIAATMNEMLTTDAGIREAISEALDAVIRGAAGLDDRFTLEGINISSGSLRVLPGCPMD
jgi:hypothetical protein